MKENKSYTLTKAEIQIMNILWEMPEGGCVHDIIARYDEPKPAYTTIATFMKILQNKKFVEVSQSKWKDTHLLSSDDKGGIYPSSDDRCQGQLLRRMQIVIP